MSNIEIKFICEPSKYNDVRDEDVWVNIFKELQILKSTVKENQYNWIEKIVQEFKKYNKRDDIEYVDTGDGLIIKFYRIAIYSDDGETQEVCCKKFENIPENIQKVLNKFGVNDYYLMCDFIAEKNQDEEMHELLEKIGSLFKDAKENSCELNHSDYDIPVEYFEDEEVSLEVQEKIMKTHWYTQWMKEYHK